MGDPEQLLLQEEYDDGQLAREVDRIDAAMDRLHRELFTVMRSPRWDEPVSVDTGGLGLTSISSGELLACGLTGRGRAVCRGWNGVGQAGFPAERWVPRPVFTDVGFVRVTTGMSQSCGLEPDGSVGDG